MSDGRVDGVPADEPNGPIGLRVRIRAGWLDEGLLGTVIGAQVLLGQWWCPVLWDGEDDPDWNKSAGLELAATSSPLRRETEAAEEKAKALRWQLDAAESAKAK